MGIGGTYALSNGFNNLCLNYTTNVAFGAYIAEVPTLCSNSWVFTDVSSPLDNQFTITNLENQLPCAMSDPVNNVNWPSFQCQPGMTPTDFTYNVISRSPFTISILNGTGPPNDNIYALTLLLNQNSDLELETVVFTPWEGITSTPSPQSWVAKDSFN